MPIQVATAGAVRLVRMDLARGNAIGRAFLTDLGRTLDALEAEGSPPLVLTGVRQVFCVGLDLVEAFDLARPDLERFVTDFEALFLRLFTWPTPTAAAVNGHAIAGGAILALACDRRFLVAGKTSFGLNEVRLGIPFPPVALEIARHAAPTGSHVPLLLEGRRFTPDEALALGLAHRLADHPERAVADAVAWAKEAAGVPARAWALVKGDLLAPALRAVREEGLHVRARFVDAWFGSDARARIAEVRDALLARRPPA
jgi:enoyl-CoA hydratase